VHKKFRAHGTTLVELLVALVFLGLTVSAMLTSIASAQSRADLAKQRAIALGVAEDDLAAARSSANKGVIAPGTTTTTKSIAGMPTLTIKRVVVLAAGFIDLYNVTTTVSFTRSVFRVNRTESIVLATMMRVPDV
jgi:type II secretory pathway pseudopilin PulG